MYEYTSRHKYSQGQRLWGEVTTYISVDNIKSSQGQEQVGTYISVILLFQLLFFHFDAQEIKKISEQLFSFFRNVIIIMKTQRGIIFLIILFLKKYKETQRRRYEKEREKKKDMVPTCSCIVEMFQKKIWNELWQQLSGFLLRLHTKRNVNDIGM